MNKKISLGIAITIVIASIAATFAITMSVSQRIYNRLIANLQDRIASYALIDELDAVIQENYYGTVVNDTRNGKMLSGYVDSLNDPSSYYLSKSAYSAYLSSMNGEINGIGVNVSTDKKSGYLKVTSVFDNSPASSAGIKEGDLISVVDGERVTKKNASKMTDALNGNKLTSVKITYIHNNKAKNVSVMMGYSAKSVYYKETGSAAYIKIDGFYANTAKQLDEVIKSLPDGTESIIFDLRGTSGGTVEYTTDALKQIVPIAGEGSGALATEIDKKGNKTYYASSSASLSGYSIVVLTDSETSCCGELFACDLRDFGMAQIVGETTKGNADVSRAFALSNGSGVVLTVAKVYPYITETFDGVGVEPDIKVLSEKNTEDKDVQLLTAIDYLSKK
ncbi:MAG: S41 family peptidase [Clostridia bacterium]|nr:S41 family peptidase [Clostridia bacterium]